MISGTMWNSIRGAAMSGQKEIISPQFQQQYIIETNIVTFLCTQRRKKGGKRKKKGMKRDSFWLLFVFAFALLFLGFGPIVHNRMRFWPNFALLLCPIVHYAMRV